MRGETGEKTQGFKLVYSSINNDVFCISETFREFFFFSKIIPEPFMETLPLLHFVPILFQVVVH